MTMRGYIKKELFRLRLWQVWVFVLATAGLFSGCTELSGTWPDREEETAGEDKKYPVVFSLLSFDEGEQTRASQVVESGQLRLVVYGQGVEPVGEPVANRVYTVADGVLTAADGAGDLELPSGTYRFYALMTPDRTPLSGGEIGGFQHGDDPLASLTEAAVEAGGVVALEPLTHKASRVEFVISRAADATYQSLSVPSCLTLSNQTVPPVSFRLGTGGGSLQITPGKVDTLCFKTFSTVEPGRFRQDRVVLPRVADDFDISLDTHIDLGDGSGLQPFRLTGRVERRLFEPGRYYHFSIRVKDVGQGGDIMLMVTDWNHLGWEDNMGGNGVSIVVGQWTGVVWNDEMGS